MTFTVDSKTVLVFDLDDTLYSEIDYLTSAFREISILLEKEIGRNLFDEMLALYHSGSEVFGNIISSYGIKTKTKGELLYIYRNHVPDIQLSVSTANKLDELKQSGISMGLITDGRSVTQRNKLRSLNIHTYFDEILISEEFGSGKPCIRNFRYMQSKLPGKHYAYIGDNIEKDFIAPNSLGWSTICLLDKGNNIHPQHCSIVKNPLKRPQIFIKSFSGLKVNSSETPILKDIPKYLEIE